MGFFWERVKEFDYDWFKKVVALMMSTHNRAPLWDKFEPVCLEEKNRRWRENQVKSFSDEVHPWEHSIFSKDEIQEIFTVMKDAASGKISRQDAELYAKVLERTIRERQQKKCDQCDGGILMAEKIGVNAMPYAFRCSCDFGNRTDVNYPRWNEHYVNHFRPCQGQNKNLLIEGTFRQLET